MQIRNEQKLIDDQWSDFYRGIKGLARDPSEEL